MHIDPETGELVDDGQEDQPPGIRVGTAAPPQDYRDQPPGVTISGTPTEMAAGPSNNLSNFDEAPSEVPAAYQGQAYPGMPIIGEGGRFYAGGNNGYGGQGGNAFDTEEQAMAARAQQAQADVPAQQAFQARAQAREGMQPEDEPTSIQIRAEMDRNSLSPADKLEMTQMQNGIARLQRDAREGRVPALQAAKLEADLRRRMAPKMYTIQQLHGLQAAYQVAHMRETVMHQTIANTRARAYDAANGMTQQSNVMGPNGRPIAVMVRNADGSSHPVAVPDTETIAANRAAERETAARHAQLQHITQEIRAVNHDIQGELRDWRDPVNAPRAPEWTKTTAGIDEERRRRSTQVHQDAAEIFRSLNMPAGNANANAPGGGGSATGTQGTGQGGSRSQTTGVQTTTTTATGNANPWEAETTAAARATARTAAAAQPPAQRPLPEQGRLPATVAGPNGQQVEMPVRRVDQLRRNAEELFGPSAPQNVGNNANIARVREAIARPFNPETPLPTDPQDLGRLMLGIVTRASQENNGQGRPLSRDEQWVYDRAQRRLEAARPVQGEALDLTPSPVQRAFNAPPSQVTTAHQEAQRIYDAHSSIWTPIQNQRLREVRDILGRAAGENRALTPNETARYLKSWEEMHRSNPDWANRIQLHR